MYNLINSSFAHALEFWGRENEQDNSQLLKFNKYSEFPMCQTFI